MNRRNASYRGQGQHRHTVERREVHAQPSRRYSSSARLSQTNQRQKASSRQSMNHSDAHSYSRKNQTLYAGARKTRSRGKFILLPLLAGIVIIALLAFPLKNFITTSQTGTSQTSDQSEEETPAISDVEQTSTSITLSFAGDCTLGTDEYFDYSTSFNAVYDDVDDPSYFMENVADIFSEDDYTIVNMEGTLTESTSRQDKTYAFKGPAEYANILSAGSIEAASLANNHSHDYGDASYTDTIEALDDAGILSFGYDRIGYADIKGVKVAFIGTYMLAEGLGIQDEMVSNIETAREEGAQVVIVFAHWGVERETVPTTEQVELGHIAIDAGADLVVGSHPHVIQGYEKYNGRYIVYSLGNFCFGGNKNPSDKDCMIFQQTFTVSGDDVATDDDIQVIPCSVSSASGYNNYQPTPAEGSEKERILEKIESSNASIAEISEALSDDSSDSA